MIDKFTLGINIRQEREKRKLTQAQLAEMIDKSAKEISNIELGKTEPQLNTTYALAKALGVSMDYLISVNDEFGIESYIDEITKRISSLTEQDVRYILKYINFYIDQKEDE